MTTLLRNQNCLPFDYQKQSFGLGRPTPKIDIYQSPINNIWSSDQMAHGITNMGNTCFIASTIQCLQHIPAWKNFLLREHKETCTVESDDCIVCQLARLTEMSFKKYGVSQVSLQTISRNIDKIGSRMRVGRQEDAQEFLICLFEKIQKNLTANFEKLDPASEMTTALGKIFGGYLKSQIVCTTCFTKTSGYEEYFNISLEITKASNIEETLKNFFHHEFTNCFSCDRCKGERRAVKKYSIDSLPNAIVIHLKRYSCLYSHPVKITKHIEFKERIDMKPYLSASLSNESSTYLLRGVTVHLGSSLTSGHYYSYVSDPSDQSTQRQWYCMNDSRVSESSWSHVSNEEAYLLYYVRTPTD